MNQQIDEYSTYTKSVADTVTWNRERHAQSRPGFSTVRVSDSQVPAYLRDNRTAMHNSDPATSASLAVNVSNPEIGLFDESSAAFTIDHDDVIPLPSVSRRRVRIGLTQKLQPLASG